MMKAAVIRLPRQIVVEEVDIPKIEPDEVLIAIQTCGVCHADLRPYLGSTSPPTGYPGIVGHEPAGRIAAVGERVKSLSVGQRVAFYHLRNCGTCYYCRNGHGNICTQRLPFFGAFAEYAKTREAQVFPLPDSCSFIEAAFSEPLACCINAIERLQLRPGSTVLILGAGPMGLMLTQVARLSGARVIVGEPIAERRQTALSMGADLVVDPLSEDLPARVRSLTGDLGVDGALSAIGSTKAIQDGLSSIRKLGTMIVFGAIWPAVTVSIDPNILHYGEIILTGAESSTVDQFARSVSLLSTGRVRVKELVTHALPLAKLDEGMNILMSKSAGKVVMVIGSSE